MPEGDTIWRTAAALRARLLNKTVLEARPAFLKRLEGSSLDAVEPVGKHLLMRFSCGLSLHTHMRMTGAWHLYRPGQPWQQPARRARAMLSFDDAVAVLFSAPVVELVRDGHASVAHLGPDILLADFDLDEVIRRARSAGPVPLGELLLDQRICAGIGNIYKCEALWHLRLDPWSPASDHPDQVLRGLYSRAHQLMIPRLSGRDRLIKGVHGRAGRPCPRCGTRIQIRAQGEQARQTYWCPKCQPEARL